MKSKDSRNEKKEKGREIKSCYSREPELQSRHERMGWNGMNCSGMNKRKACCNDK